MAQPWIADFCITAALDSFPFFWVLGVVFFIQCVFNVFCVLKPGFRCSFFLRPAHVPRSVPGPVWYCSTGHVFGVHGPALGWFLHVSSCLHLPLSAWLWSGQSGHSIVAQDCHFFVFFSFSFCRSSPRSESETIWVFWLLRLWHRTVWLLVLSFSVVQFCLAPPR